MFLITHCLLNDMTEGTALGNVRLGGSVPSARLPAAVGDVPWTPWRLTLPKNCCLSSGDNQILQIRYLHPKDLLLQYHNPYSVLNILSAHSELADWLHSAHLLRVGFLFLVASFRRKASGMFVRDVNPNLHPDLCKAASQHCVLSKVLYK